MGDTPRKKLELGSAIKKKNLFSLSGLAGASVLRVGDGLGADIQYARSRDMFWISMSFRYFILRSTYIADHSRYSSNNRDFQGDDSVRRYWNIMQAGLGLGHIWPMFDTFSFMKESEQRAFFHLTYSGMAKRAADSFQTENIQNRQNYYGPGVSASYAWAYDMTQNTSLSLKFFYNINLMKSSFLSDESNNEVKHLYFAWAGLGITWMILF